MAGLCGPSASIACWLSASRRRSRSRFRAARRRSSRGCGGAGQGARGGECAIDEADGAEGAAFGDAEQQGELLARETARHGQQQLGGLAREVMQLQQVAPREIGVVARVGGGVVQGFGAEPMPEMVQRAARVEPCPLARGLSEHGRPGLQQRVGGAGGEQSGGVADHHARIVQVEDRDAQMSPVTALCACESASPMPRTVPIKPIAGIAQAM